jgi:hypothetical protein
MKKILCMALTLVLALSLMTVPVLAADSGSATISVTASKSTLAVGDTVTYTISITGGAGLTGMSFDLGLTGLSLDKYDFLCLGEDKFQENFSIGDETATLVKLTGSGNAYTFYATGTKNITGVVGDSWDILTLTCKATEAVADAAKALTLSNTSLYTSKPTSTGSAQEIDVSSTVTYGVKEVQTLLGDLNGNGMIDLGDLVLIRRYLLKLDTDIDSTVGDLNGDGQVNLGDLVMVRRILLKLD